MTFKEYKNYDFINTFFIDLLKENKNSILTIMHEKEFLISGSPIIDFGRVS